MNVSSDEGYIFEDIKTKSYALFDYAREQFDTADSASTIITLYVNSGVHYQEITRNYMKFTELAATVGGIVNVCMIIGKLLTRLFSESQMKIKMLNALFFFDTVDKD